jgi:hypothetical protein
MKKRQKRRGDVILLNDLAPRKDVRGGAAKRVFGERIEAKPSSGTPVDEKPGSQNKSKRQEK